MTAFGITRRQRIGRQSSFPPPAAASPEWNRYLGENHRISVLETLGDQGIFPGHDHNFHRLDPELAVGEEVHLAFVDRAARDLSNVFVQFPLKQHVSQTFPEPMEVSRPVEPP